MPPHIFTIAPHAPFLDLLAEKVLDGTLLGDWPRQGPFWLSDVTIILPTRRAANALVDSFVRAAGPGLLLPDIRTFGGEPEDEEPFLPPHDTSPVPASVSPTTRRLLLAELVGFWLKSNPGSPLAGPDGPNPVQILSLADSLATLIDDFCVEQVDPHLLQTLKDQDLSSYWEACLNFLEIALIKWPEILAEMNRVDAAEARNLRLARQAETAALVYGERPVIAAGSTGSVPATATLMRAISRLPRGALVLPGLDTTLSPAAIDLRRDPGEQSHGHPQYQLVHLLGRIGASPEQVEELAATAPDIRTTLIRRALDPAAETTHWHEMRSSMDEATTGAALDRVAIAISRGEQEEAAAVALAGLDALRQGRQVGIIAPDRNLARRISSELARCGVTVDDSAGTPLHQARAGRLARQVLALADGNFAAVDLMGLLRNRYLLLGRPRSEMARLGRKIEFGLLRGQRPAAGIAGLKRLLDANISREQKHVALRLNEEDEASLGAFLSDLEAALQPLIALRGKQFRITELADALVAALDALRQPPAGTTAPALPGEQELRAWARAFADPYRPGPLLDFSSAEPALAQLMAGHSVRVPAGGDPRIAIWGRLEARLQPADLMILTALNEGTWPEVADPGPWLNRQMRLAIGLEPPERQHGLAAHDFEMALGSPEVLLTYAERVGTSPATPSRLVQRLTGFVGETVTADMVARGQHWIDAARHLDRPGVTPQPANRPEPSPPAGLRARRLSVTRVEQLFRSPYDIYAGSTLGLRPVEPLGAEADARERGNIIHEVFARFVEENIDPAAASAHERIMELAAATFAQLESIPERRDIWLKRFERSADGFLRFECERAPRVLKRHAEQALSWHTIIAGEPFKLHGRADRIDVMQDGTVEIMDFKTGSPPNKSEMQNYLAPQLPLEALIVANAGFGEGADKQDPHPAGALTYIKIGASPAAFEVHPFALPEGEEMPQVLDTLKRKLDAHIQRFLMTDSQPMMAGLYPRPTQRFAGDFDHLARLKEWTVAAGEADE